MNRAFPCVRGNKQVELRTPVVHEKQSIYVCPGPYFEKTFIKNRAFFFDEKHRFSFGGLKAKKCPSRAKIAFKRLERKSIQFKRMIGKIHKQVFGSP